MPSVSHGILAYKRGPDNQLYLLLAHPGGPYYKKQDLWTIPKGEPDTSDADALVTAKREFSEETGLTLPAGDMLDLGEVKQSSIKINHIWAIESGNLDLSDFISNTFELEWPPKSGQRRSFPEIDRIAWFDIESAKAKLFPSQREFALRLQNLL